MGRLPTGNRRYNIQEMQNIHHEVARLLLLGMKHVEVASRLGVTPTMVSYTANSPVVKRQLAVMRGARDVSAVDCAQRIKELAPIAIERLEKLLDSENEQIVHKTAVAVLDRAGHAPVQRMQADMVHMHFTANELDDIKSRARNFLSTETVDVVEAEEVKDDNGV